MPKHTLSVLVENKPGVLARIAALFSRRGFNIDSLAVGPTEHSDVSRMTVVVDVEELPLEAAEGKEPRHGEEDEEDVEEEEADADPREKRPLHGASRSLYPTP